jgi:hypothetical protein
MMPKLRDAPVPKAMLRDICTAARRSHTPRMAGTLFRSRDGAVVPVMVRIIHVFPVARSSAFR